MLLFSCRDTNWLHFYRVKNQFTLDEGWRAICSFQRFSVAFFFTFSPTVNDNHGHLKKKQKKTTSCRFLGWIDGSNHRQCKTSTWCFCCQKPLPALHLHYALQHHREVMSSANKLFSCFASKIETQDPCFGHNNITLTFRSVCNLSPNRGCLFSHIIHQTKEKCWPQNPQILSL